MTLPELISGTLVYYPQYINPQTNQRIDAETAINILHQQKLEKGQGSVSRHFVLKKWGKLQQLWRLWKMR